MFVGLSACELTSSIVPCVNLLVCFKYLASKALMMKRADLLLDV